MMRREKEYIGCSLKFRVSDIFMHLKHFQTILRIHPCLYLAIESKSCIFQWIINRQSIQAPLGIRSSLYPVFCPIAINPEDVTVIVVNIDAVMHRVIFCVYQFHYNQSFHFIGGNEPVGLIWT